MKSVDYNKYMSLFGDRFSDMAPDAVRFELFEEKVLKRTKFPVYMLFPLLSVALAMGAVLTFPLTSGLAIAGFIHLNIISYGIVNDMLGVRNSMEYFRLGHQPGQIDEVTIPSTDKEAQAFHWGVFATWFLSAVGATVVGFSAAIAAPVTPLIYPLISALTVGVLVRANSYSKAKMVDFKDDTHIPSLPLRYVEAKKNWHRCSDRNSFGYRVLPLTGVALAAGIYTSAFNGLAAMLPTALLPLASPLMPVIISAPMMLFVGGMFVNYLRNRNHVDLDQTLPRKFKTNLNFMREIDQSANNTPDITLTPQPDLSSNLETQSNIIPAPAARITVLQEMFNARVTSRERAGSDSEIKQCPRSDSGARKRTRSDFNIDYLEDRINADDTKRSVARLTSGN